MHRYITPFRSFTLVRGKNRSGKMAPICYLVKSLEINLLCNKYLPVFTFCEWQKAKLGELIILTLEQRPLLNGKIEGLIFMRYCCVYFDWDQHQQLTPPPQYIYIYLQKWKDLDIVSRRKASYISRYQWYLLMQLALHAYHGHGK